MSKATQNCCYRVIIIFKGTQPAWGPFPPEMPRLNPARTLYAHVYINTNTNTYKHVDKHTNTHTCIHTYINTYTYIYTYTLTYTHAHILATNIHTYTPFLIHSTYTCAIVHIHTHIIHTYIRTGSHTYIDTCIGTCTCKRREGICTSKTIRSNYGGVTILHPQRYSWSL